MALAWIILLRKKWIMAIVIDMELELDKCPARPYCD